MTRKLKPEIIKMLNWKKYLISNLKDILRSVILTVS